MTFKNKIFVLCPKSKKLAAKIKKEKGTVASRMSVKVNYFIVSDLTNAVKKRIVALENNKKNKCIVLKPEFVTDSLKGKKIKPTKKYILEEESEEEESTEEESEKSESEKSESEKSESGSESEEKTRKRKKKSKDGSSKKKKKTNDKTIKKKKDDKKKDEKKKVEKKKKKKPKVVPISTWCSVGSTAEVVIDGDEIYSVMLNQTNLGQNNNKFYEIQLIHEPNGYKVFTHWGRVGYRGQVGYSFFSDQGSAVREFQKKYKLKTGNNWENRDNFVPKNRKYQPVEVVYEAESESDEADNSGSGSEEDNEDESSSDDEPLVCTLEPQVKEFIELIFNKKTIQKTLKSLNINQEKAPLGKLSKEQIKKGYEILKRIEQILDRKVKGNITQESSNFYTIIPHSFGFQRLPSINSKTLIQEKVDLLDTLKQISIAGKMIGDQEKKNKKKNKKKQKETEHVLNKYYKDLNCELEAVEKGSKEWKMIEKYVLNGGKPLGYNPRVLNILRTFHPDQIENFKQYEKKDERWLLWHGSRLSNAVGILSQGLRIAPPEAPCSGYLFGKGVYFASALGKSAGYTCAYGSQPAIMYLNEVYLGKRHELKTFNYVSKLPKGTHSTWGIGRKTPDPKKVKKFNSYKIPLGELKDLSNNGIYLDEHIVYNTDQIKCRYVITLSLR
ncbi:DNA ligase [Anaeramoeba flamelloides]|uniref:Poly [ADP-ribose] polymerase n=1 Tax=Anaeramoeba flamelloides TaxID=1746091 RepID=A0AAV8AGY1_9EUKA|nr:DNA ligase [Anaeramoeba flamelloides]